MITKVLAKTLYGVIGVLFLLAGGSVLLVGTGLLPEPMRRLIFDIGHGDGNSLHIMQELSSLLVFAGLITLWFVRHYEQSRPFHWAMTVFWGLIALVHWFDVRNGFEAGIGQVVITIPFALF